MKDCTDMTVILDRSGSMATCSDDTITGFNKFITSQKECSKPCTFSLIQFDDQYEVVHSGIPLSEVPLLHHGTYQPRGSTALFDAMCKTINSVGKRLSSLPEGARPDQVLIVVLTDGFENSSREYNAHNTIDLVNHQRNKYSWTFVFLGADMDAIACGATLGLHHNVRDYSKAQTISAFASLDSAAKKYREREEKTCSLNFFS